MQQQLDVRQVMQLGDFVRRWKKRSFERHGLDWRGMSRGVSIVIFSSLMRQRIDGNPGYVFSLPLARLALLILERRLLQLISGVCAHEYLVS